MERVRGRVGTVLVAALVGVVVLLAVQGLLLALPPVAAAPAGLASGVVAAWARPHDELRERLVTAAATAAATVVVLGLWMIPSTPSGYVLRIVFGWVVVAFVLTAVHALVTSVAPIARTAARRAPSARLR